MLDRDPDTIEICGDRCGDPHHTGDQCQSPAHSRDHPLPGYRVAAFAVEGHG